MDPRFQQQNPSPYPQANPNFPSGTQSGPNIYPTLPSPQNPQYNQHPQQYPPQTQYNPQMNSYGQAGAPAGYIPPAYYGNVQVVQNHGVNNDSFLMATKIRELERGLDSCFVKCYQVWLWLIIIGGSMNSFKTIVSLLTGDTSSMGSFMPVMLGYGIWSIIQSIFGVMAISQKSLNKANAACWMMTLYLIPSLVVEILIINWINSYVPNPNDDTIGIVYAFMYIILFFVSAHCLFHICINMTGAFKVRKILAQRGEVEEKMRLLENPALGA